MPAVTAVTVDRAVPAVPAVPGMQQLADRVGLVPPVATILVSLVPLRVRLVRQATALLAVMAVALVTVARVVMQVPVARAGAVPAVLRRLAEQQAAAGRVGTRAPATRRAGLAVPVVQARAWLVVPARVAPEARVTVVPRPVAPAVPAVPRLQVQEERLRPVLVATGRPPAVPGLAVPRAAREPQELVVQEPVAQGPPVRLPECPGMPGPSE